MKEFAMVVRIEIPYAIKKSHIETGRDNLKKDKKIDEMKAKIKDWRSLFENDEVYGTICFAIDNRTWQYAIKFQNKLKATDITKIKNFIFEKEKLADFEFRPDASGDAIWFVFNLLDDGATIGG